MCSTVRWKGRHIETLGEARKLWGDRVVFRDDYAPNLPDDSCLCPLDEQATAAALGCTTEPWEHDSMCFVFQPSSPEKE